MVAIVYANIVFTAGAIVLAVILGLIVAARHRRPRSPEATVDSFSRGLAALSPEAQARRRRRQRTPATEPAARPLRSSGVASTTVRTTYPGRLGVSPQQTEAETG